MTRWRTIVVDPPWSYTQHWKRSDQWRSLSGRMFKRGGAGGRYKAGERGAAAPYDCMSLEEIAALPIGDCAEEDAHIYVWTTNTFLEATFPLLEGWGFTYKTMLTWQKHQLGMGLYFRNTTEHVLFGVRGKLKLRRRDVPTHFTAARTRHSEKPQAFYDMVETTSPGPYLDVFARKQRMGWDVAGDQVYSAIPELTLHSAQRGDEINEINAIKDAEAEGRQTTGRGQAARQGDPAPTLERRHRRAGEAGAGPAAGDPRARARRPGDADGQEGRRDHLPAAAERPDDRLRHRPADRQDAVADGSDGRHG